MSNDDSLENYCCPEASYTCCKKYLHTMSATSVFLLSIILWLTVSSGVMNRAQEFQSRTAFPAILVFHR